MDRISRGALSVDALAKGTVSPGLTRIVRLVFESTW